jgi:hypothetical protein
LFLNKIKLSVLVSVFLVFIVFGFLSPQVANATSTSITNVSSGAFSGYKVVGGPGSVTYVAGSWKVPKVDCESGWSPEIILFVGLDVAVNAYDYYTSGLQLGLQAWCNEYTHLHGTTPFYVWNGALYTFSFPYNKNPKVGDSVLMTITYLPYRHDFKLQMYDATTNVRSVPIVVSSSRYARNSADWFTERPGGDVFPAIQFNMYSGVHYTGISGTDFAKINGVLGPIGSFSHVVRVSPGGGTPSPLYNSRYFYVHWG